MPECVDNFFLQGSLFKLWFLCSNVQFYVEMRIFMFKCAIFMSDCVNIFLCKASVFFCLKKVLRPNVQFYVKMCISMSKYVFLCHIVYCIPGHSEYCGDVYVLFLRLPFHPHQICSSSICR